MNREIYKKLQEIKPLLQQRFGISKIALVGSQARGDYTSKSDVDIVIVEGKKSYFNRYKAIEFLSHYLGKKVDMFYFDSVRPVIKEYLKQDMLYV